MDYSEFPPPDELLPLVKLGWTLAIPDGGPEWFGHEATPDGCMEIIRRLTGRSQWDGEQPACFVAGAITQPAKLKLGAGSRFVAIRIWPWTWRLISGQDPGKLADSWAPLAQAAPDLDMPASFDAAFQAMAPYSATSEMRAIWQGLDDARTPGELARRAGMTTRGLQRWFARHVGQPPRTYLRMVRFADAFADLADNDSSLAEHAAGHGFADQAHMAREFRELAGAAASDARDRARGPFIEQKIDRS